MNWINAFNIPKCKSIAIDGKTSRRSHDKDKKALHLISAFASESKIILGQKKVDGKTNEITEIPELLNWLDLQESIVTIDAMGCQTKIASQITNQGGDYVLSLKGNQSNLHDELINYFEQAKKHGTQGVDFYFFEEKNKGHGREEIRKIYVTDKIDFLPQKNEWNKLKSIVCVSSERIVGDKKSKENRYFITSLPCMPQKIGKAIRDHWAIESVPQAQKGVQNELKLCG